MTSPSHHPIQVVARRTGLSVDTIRAWEKRYAAVTPERTATGRRVYTDEEIERLLLLRQVMEGGRRISQIAALDRQQLQKLADDDRAATGDSPRRKPARSGLKSGAVSHVEECLEAASRLDKEALDHALSRAQVELSARRFVIEVAGPLLSETGKRWQAGSLRITHEHLVSSAVRALLQAQLLQNPSPKTAPAAVITTLSGQRHDLGALMAAVIAASEGWRAVFLGASLPAEEIASAALQTSARAVVLSLIYPEDDPRIVSELLQLRRLLPEDLPVVVGGRASAAYLPALAQMGAQCVTSLDALSGTLREIRTPRVAS